MAARQFSNVAVETTLSSGIIAGAASLTVVSATGWPAAPFILVIEPDLANEELILVGAKAGAVFSSLTRGFGGTSDVGHSAADVIKHVVVGEDFALTYSHIHKPSTDDTAAVTHADLLSVSKDQHHLEDHAARHSIGGADALVSGIPEMVRNRVLDNSGGTISTAEVIEKTLAITIPAAWNTYDVDIFIGVRVFESGVFTASRNIDLKIRKVNVTGAILGQTTQQIGQASPNTIEVMTFMGFIIGETSTGTRDFHFTSQLSGDTSQGSWDDLRFVIYAWRVT